MKLFSKRFSTVFNTNTANNYPSSSDNYSGNIWNDHHIHLYEIHEKLKSLNAKLSAGPDELPALLFKRCSSSLTFPLYIIYNKSLKDGEFPKEWKNVFVTPIYKKGAVNDALNYRPVSKASIIAKILDNLMADALSMNFSTMIPNQQHGFVKRRSTVTNLVSHTESLQRCIDKGGQTDTIYFDFSSAFDTVPHERLLDKLKSLGINGTILKWFSSFLKDRTQQIKIDNILSSKAPVISSVIQGSHCGPILFTLYIHDIGELLDVDYSIYADDIKIRREINCIEDCLKLQSNTDRLATYAKINGLSLNIAKCNFVRYTMKRTTQTLFDYRIDGELIRQETQFKDLGVTFDQKMTFNSHVDIICRKSRQMMGFVLRNSTEFKSPETVVALFKSLARSSLEYASPIWNPTNMTQTNQIERVQHKFIKILARRYYNDSSFLTDYQWYEERLNLPSLKLRRIILDVNFAIKSFNKQIDSSTYIDLFNFRVPSRTTRQNQVFSLNASRINGRVSVMNRIMQNFNDHVNDIDALSGNSITKNFASNITTNYYNSV